MWFAWSVASHHVVEVQSRICLWTHLGPGRLVLHKSLWKEFAKRVATSFLVKIILDFSVPVSGLGKTSWHKWMLFVSGWLKEVLATAYNTIVQKYELPPRESTTFSKPCLTLACAMALSLFSWSNCKTSQSNQSNTETKQSCKAEPSLLASFFKHSFTPAERGSFFQTGVVILPSQTMCTVIRDVPQIYHTFAASKMGNLMTPCTVVRNRLLNRRGIPLSDPLQQLVILIQGSSLRLNQQFGKKTWIYINGSIIVIYIYN